MKNKMLYTGIACVFLPLFIMALWGAWEFAVAISLFSVFVSGWMVLGFLLIEEWL